jgi:selenocysteine lyase/cysteine desulfurase
LKEYSGSRTEAPGQLQCQKHEFGLPDDVRYLNCAYMSPLPRNAEEAGVRGMSVARVPTSIEASDFFGPSDEIRRRFARLVGAPDSKRVAIIPSVSYGVAIAARNLDVESGQTIVLLHEQFPGNVYAWRRKAEDCGAEIRTVVPPDVVARGAAWNERIVEAIDENTAIVTLPHVHWTDGTVFDLVAIGRRAREVGAAFVVDGTQSVGALPFDVAEIQPDALIVAAYKWLLGPYATALAYLGPRFDGGVPLEETWFARVGSEDFKNLVVYQDEYQPGPAIRYDVGERANFLLLPMLQASLDLLLQWTPDSIQDYCRRLAAPLIEASGSLGFSVEQDEWRADHLFGLRMPVGLELEALKAELEARRIFVSLRGSALRVSPNVYNDESDVEALIEALRGAVGAGGR